MAKIKFTKTELKAQQDALRRFRRFLPTLQLKKQQLQAEIRLSRERLAENRRQQRELIDEMASWIAVYGDLAMLAAVGANLRLSGVARGSMSIAGVVVPTFTGASFEMPPLDAFGTPWYADEAAEGLKKALSLRAAGRIIEEQERLLSEELRVTSQRVNLFEKVKIPETRENIRRIRIQLGDQDTSAVARSKIAKGKQQEVAV